MFRTLFNLGIGLAGGKVQLAVWAVVIIGGGLYIANHQRVVKEHAMLEQRAEDLKLQKEKVEAEYAGALESLQVEREKLAAVKDAQAKERASMASVRGQIAAGLAEGIGSIAAKGQTLETDIRSIPASELDSRIRGALGRARGADAELARIRAAH